MSDTREEQIEAALYEPEIARFPDFVEAVRGVIADLRAAHPAVIRLPDTPEQQAEILAAIEKRKFGAITLMSKVDPGLRETALKFLDRHGDSLNIAVVTDAEYGDIEETGLTVGSLKAVLKGER